MNIHPGLEELSPRIVPTITTSRYLIIDCTPDPQHESFTPAPFAAVFARGQGPDVNGDGRHDLGDLVPAENLIFQRVKKLYSPFGVDVRLVDRNCQSFAGQRWLSNIADHPDVKIDVCYLGDSAPDNPFWNGVVGISFIPPVGKDLCYYDYVFAGPLAGLDTAQFLYGAAVGVAHELAHLQGLLHPQDQGEFGNVMNAFLSDSPWLARWSHTSEVMEDGTTQNAGRELQQGWNQQNVDGAGSTYFFAHRAPPANAITVRSHRFALDQQ